MTGIVKKMAGIAKKLGVDVIHRGDWWKKGTADVKKLTTNAKKMTANAKKMACNGKKIGYFWA